MHGRRSDPKETSHSRRQYPLLSASGVGVNWNDVPDNLIVELVRAYTSGGDAILFGTSKGQDVCAIRVYRGREPYSVYFRKASEMGEALDRLYRLRPARKHEAEPRAVPDTEAQGVKILPLPFHPKFTVKDLIKQRKDWDTRMREWDTVYAEACRRFDRLATA